MHKKLAFDTLRYAKILEKGGITHGDVYSTALADALSQNFYTKHETDMILERIGGLTNQIDKIDSRIDKIENHMDKIDGRIDKIENRMDIIDGRIDKIENRLDIIDSRIDKIEKNVYELKNEMHQMKLDLKDQMHQTGQKTIQRISINMGIMIAFISILTSVLRFAFH